MPAINDTSKDAEENETKAVESTKLIVPYVFEPVCGPTKNSKN